MVLLELYKEKKKWFCTNVAENEDDFILSSDEYFEIVKQCDIFAIVHNHPDASNEPSPADINNCNALGTLTGFLVIQKWSYTS